jgi:tetratricopeptide (TPR) repeat protein
MVIKRFLVILSYLCVAQINAQVSSGCLTKHQMFKMQSSELEDISFFLNNEGWSFNGAQSKQPYNYFDYPIEYNIVTWDKSSYYDGGDIIIYNSVNKPNIVIYQTNNTCFNEILHSCSSTQRKTSVDDDKLVTIIKENSISVEFREYKNDYSDKKYSILIYNSSALVKEISVLKEKEEALKREETEKKRRFEEFVSEGDLLYSSNNFNAARLKYFLARDIIESDLVAFKIDLCDKAICESIVLRGDSLFKNGSYELSLNQYLEAKNCDKSTAELNDKIKITRKKILDSKINSIKLLADSYFESKNYDLALEKYNEIIQLDKSNSNASERINQINSLKRILEKRSNILFSYKTTNNIDFIRFKSLLLEEANSNIRNYVEGYVNLNYSISFDTSGYNTSTVNDLSSSISDYSSKFSSIISKSNLSPSSEGGYFLASQEEIGFNLKWQSSRKVVKSESKGIFSKDENLDLSTMESFINNQSMKYGRFVFDVKRSDLNGKTFSNINLVKYKTTGPESAFFSMLMPGMGTLKVTYGKKGWGRFTSFILSTALAIGSKYYADLQYKNYLTSTSQLDIDRYYNIANQSYKTSLIAGGIAATIYIYDILWVISKGSKNLRESKQLRKQLRQGPIQIQNQSISWL